ncbi:hypothetical protein C8R45DRAFT_1091541 [Mycena sanguinolenta]|nr:hypothetical protein C8R45DRAFT_1091541 [Mycena sanguinolenta]
MGLRDACKNLSKKTTLLWWGDISRLIHRNPSDPPSASLTPVFGSTLTPLPSRRDLLRADCVRFYVTLVSTHPMPQRRSNRPPICLFTPSPHRPLLSSDCASSLHTGSIYTHHVTRLFRRILSRQEVQLDVRIPGDECELKVHVSRSRYGTFWPRVGAIGDGRSGSDASTSSAAREPIRYLGKKASTRIVIAIARRLVHPRAATQTAFEAGGVTTGYPHTHHHHVFSHPITPLLERLPIFRAILDIAARSSASASPEHDVPILATKPPLHRSPLSSMAKIFVLKDLGLDTVLPAAHLLPRPALPESPHCGAPFPGRAAIRGWVATRGDRVGAMDDSRYGGIPLRPSAARRPIVPTPTPPRLLSPRFLASRLQLHRIRLRLRLSLDLPHTRWRSSLYVVVLQGLIHIEPASNLTRSPRPARPCDAAFILERLQIALDTTASPLALPPDPLRSEGVATTLADGLGRHLPEPTAKVICSPLGSCTLLGLYACWNRPYPRIPPTHPVALFALAFHLDLPLLFTVAFTSSSTSSRAAVQSRYIDITLVPPTPPAARSATLAVLGPGEEGQEGHADLLALRQPCITCPRVAAAFRYYSVPVHLSSVCLLHKPRQVHLDLRVPSSPLSRPRWVRQALGSHGGGSGWESVDKACLPLGVEGGDGDAFRDSKSGFACGGRPLTRSMRAILAVEACAGELEKLDPDSIVLHRSPRAYAEALLLSSRVLPDLDLALLVYLPSIHVLFHVFVVCDLSNPVGYGEADEAVFSVLDLPTYLETSLMAEAQPPATENAEKEKGLNPVISDPEPKPPVVDKLMPQSQ